MELLSRCRPWVPNCREAVRNATGRATGRTLQTGRRLAAFDLDLHLGEVSVLQCATHYVQASNSFLICSSQDCLTQAKTQLEGDESTLHDVNLLSACVSKFALVCGASGSGKTMAALTSCGSEGLVWHTTAHGLGNFEELSGDSRDVAVLKAISDTIKRRIEGMTISTTFEDNFVLVVDDAGNMPGLVRSLCRVEKSIREEVATLLKLSANRTSFLVCGSGVERADGARGSVPPSYCLINLSNPKNELSFFKSYTLPRIRNMFPLLAAALTNPSLSGCDAINRHSIVLQCRRLLRNRHMAALFLTQLKKLEDWSAFQRDGNYCDSRWWPMQLVAMMQQVLLDFRSVQFAGISTHELTLMHAEALAMCLGGPNQHKALLRSESLERLFSLTGLLQDNRRVVSAHVEKLLTVAERINDEPDISTELQYYGLEAHPGAVTQHRLRCFSMATAMVEGGLCGFSNVAPGSSGFRHSIARIAVLWMRAQTSAIPIDLSLPDSFCSGRGLLPIARCST